MHEPAVIDFRRTEGAAMPLIAPPGILRVLRRHLRLLLITAAVVIGAAAIGLLVIEPRYQAVAVMRVDVDEIKPSDDQQGTSSIRDAQLLREIQIETQIQTLSSRPVARATVRDLALHDDREFNPAADPDKPRAPGLRAWIRSWFEAAPAPAPQQLAAGGAIPPQLIEQTTDRLLGALKVEQDGKSSFVTVAVTSTDPAKAARIANKITTNYIDNQVAERRGARRREVDTLRRRVDELGRHLVATERSIASYRRAHGIDPGVGNEANAAQAGRLSSELAAARGARAESEARTGRGSVTGQAMSPLLADLRAQGTAVERRLAELSTLYGTAHPDVLKAGAELAEVRQEIGAETSRIQLQLANEASAQAAREARLGGDLGAMRAQSMGRLVASVPLADMERDAATTQTVYLALLQRLQQLSGQDTFKADATIASPALLPTSPSFPQRGRLLGVAAAAALILGMILVFLAESLDNQVRTAAQVFALTGIPTLGMIPYVSNRRERWLAHLAVVKKPGSAFAESIRMAHGRLSRQLGHVSGHVVLITSPLPGDGKTTVAMSLAAAAVAVGQTAIILDLDLRRPRLLDFTAGQDSKDLIDFLAGEAMLEEVLMPSESLPALQAIGTRTAPPDPGAALASPALADLFERLKARYDLIVVNAPPVLAVGDAQDLAPRCDAVLLVLRWGRTTPEMLQSTIEQFDVPLAGAVFNRVRFSRHASMAYGDRLQYLRKYAPYHQPLPRRPRRLRWAPGASDA